jgi:hypothetical protein
MTEDGNIYYEDPNMDEEFYGTANAIDSRKRVASMAIIIPVAMKIVAKLNPKLEVVGQYGDTFGQKGAEIVDDMYMLADVIKTTTPEAENYLRTKYGKDLSYFATRAKIAAEQAQRFQTKLGQEDPDLLASSNRSIPREPFVTKPGQSRAGV